MMSDDENKNIDNGMDIIDEPLLIVLDEDDDDDEFESYDLTTTSSNSILVNHTEEQTIISNEISEKGKQSKIEVKNLIESCSIKSNTKSSNQSEKSNKSIRTIVIDTNFIRQTTRQQRRSKSMSKRKTIPTSNNLPNDSVLSYISFDKVSNILTVSRMGSIYYCVEDLYIKIFSSLCTLDEFINLLLKPEILIIKQVTLSEKLSITQQIPKLKKFSQIRYRLLSIDSFDYLIKLKQLLLTYKNNKHIEKMIDEMRCYKQTSTTLLVHDKVSPKLLPIDNTEQQKCFKSEVNQTGIFLECDSIYSNNETISKISNTNLINCSIIKSENPFRRLYRSKSLTNNKEEIKTYLSRSYSLSSIKFDTEENNMFKLPSKITKSFESVDDNYPMPMIVNVEENVQFNYQKIHSPEQLPSYSQSLHNTMSPVSSSPNSIPYPYLYRSSPHYLKSIQTPYNLYYRESYPSPPPYQESNKPVSNHYDPVITSILGKPISHQEFISQQQTSTLPCFLPCCSTDQPSISKPIHPNERMIYRQHSSPSYNKKQQRIRLTPYAPVKTYFAPLSNRHSSLEKSSTFISPPNTPNDLRLPYICTRSIPLSQAILEHYHCDIDHIPKLVVRHTKMYSTKSIDTMGQLFPTWFNEPDYRCIHCFNCDQVFTPQLFMTHIDDVQLSNEQPVNMTSIQLLSSEKLSEYKVELWNQFCTNLTIYAREGRIAGFLGNRKF